MMKFRCVIAVFILTALGPLSSAPSMAQDREPANATYSQASKSLAKAPVERLLSADEGLAVLGAALESRVRTDTGTDCSHLVHAIYERAGFPYSYASSSSLYAGTEEFRRVTRPQPGDLVVWQGHAGIVVNPAQHTFFSALRSGHGVEPYDSSYWNQRGRPRFFRYITASPGANRGFSRSETASLKPDTSSIPQPADKVNLDASEEAQTQAAQTQADSDAETMPVATVASLRPTAGEISAALVQSLSAHGDGLQATDMLNPTKPVVVFDQLSISHVRLQRDRGWTDVRFTGALKLSRQKTSSDKHTETQRWQIRRGTRDRWEIVIPSDAVYIPSEVAVRMLAHQLAALTDDSPEEPSTAKQKLQLSRLLNLSLQSERQ